MKLLPAPYDSIREEAGVSTWVTAAGLLCLWLVPGCLSALETFVNARLSGRDVTVLASLFAEAPGWLIWAPATPLILWAGDRLPLERGPFLRHLLGHLPLALLCGAAYAMVASATWRLAAPFPTDSGFGRMAVSWFISALPLVMLVYFGVLGSGRALLWFTRHRQVEVQAARLSSQLAEARLSALRMQLNPHFLFNSLNAVTVLVRDRKAEDAEAMLELISGLLRDTLRTDREPRVCLEEELDFVRRYLAVESVRFSDRLRVRIDMGAGLADALVPDLVLQPLVENALRHGIGRGGDAGRVEISARALGDRLVLEVFDDGPGPSDSMRNGAEAGVGLSNTRERLAALYGDRASCTLERVETGGTRARIELPLTMDGLDPDV